MQLLAEAEEPAPGGGVGAPTSFYLPDEIRAHVLAFLCPYAGIGRKLRRYVEILQTTSRSASDDKDNLTPLSPEDRVEEEKCTLLLQNVARDLDLLVWKMLGRHPFVVTSDYRLVSLVGSGAVVDGGDSAAVSGENGIPGLRPSSLKAELLGSGGSGNPEGRDAPAEHPAFDAEFATVVDLRDERGESGATATSPASAGVDGRSKQQRLVQFSALREALDGPDQFLEHHTAIPKLASAISCDAGELLRWDLYRTVRRGGLSKLTFSLETACRGSSVYLLLSAAQKVARRHRSLATQRVQDMCAAIVGLLGQPKDFSGQEETVPEESATKRTADVAHVVAQEGAVALGALEAT